MSTQSPSQRTSLALRHIALLVVPLLFAACGGGGGSSPSEDVREDTAPEDTAGDSTPGEDAPGDIDDVGDVHEDVDDTSGDVTPDAAPDAPLLDDESRALLRELDERFQAEAADPAFRVGYAHRSLPWRAGAKPGQTGSAALPARDTLLARAVIQILPILNQRDANILVRRITVWATGMIENTLNDVTEGVYNQLFVPSVGIELPPAVNAVVISQGDQHAAIVSADLYLPHEQFHRRVAHLVSERTGISRDRLFIGATHNHSAPHAISPAIGIWTFGDQFDPRHWVYMTHEVAETVIAAWEAREAATLRTGRTHFADVQMNIVGPSRARLQDPDGDEVEVAAGYPHDHVEDDLILLRFDRPDDDTPIAQIFVLGMHPETLRDDHRIISGEFPRHAERKIEARTGVPSLWLSGVLGDVEPDRGRNRPEARYWREGFEAMDRMTDDIADAVIALRESLDDVEADDSPLFLQAARDFAGPASQPMPRSTYLGPEYPMFRLIHDSARIRLHLIRLGDVLLVGMPGEIPTDMSWNLKSRMETGATSDAVFQGYVYDDAPAWVRERIARNFGRDVADPAHQAPIVSIISLVNSYTGYVVTRWEFENREHYRQSLTCFGPDTAEHMNALALALNAEMHGAPALEQDLPDFWESDQQGFDSISWWLRGMDAWVTAWSADLTPEPEPTLVGTVTEGPLWRAAGEERPEWHPERIELQWRGGAADVDMPRVQVEIEDEEGVWVPWTEAPGPVAWLFFEAPHLWTVSLRRPEELTRPLRFVVEGTYRSDTPGSGPAHPIWDPAGANQTYTFTSDPFTPTPR